MASSSTAFIAMERYPNADATLRSLRAMSCLAERMHPSRFAPWVMPALSAHSRHRDRLMRHLTIHTLQQLELQWTLAELANAPSWWTAPQTTDIDCLAIRIACAAARLCVKRTLIRAEIKQLTDWLSTAGWHRVQQLSDAADCLAVVLEDDAEPRRWRRHDALIFGASCMHAAIYARSPVAARLFSLQFEERQLRNFHLSGVQMLTIEDLAGVDEHI